MEPQLEQLVARRKRHVRYTDVLAKTSLVIALVAAPIPVPAVSTVLFIGAGLAACVAMYFLLESHQEGAVIETVKRSAHRPKAKRAVRC